MNVSNELCLVRQIVGKPALLAGLAEEAAELAQAALKLRRALTQDNPTPVPVEVAEANLLEEVCDVLLCMGTLQLIEDVATADENGPRIIVEKSERWIKRIKEARE